MVIKPGHCSWWRARRLVSAAAPQEAFCVLAHVVLVAEEYRDMSLDDWRLLKDYCRAIQPNAQVGQQDMQSTSGH
jgi:hypothetical protein